MTRVAQIGMIFLAFLMLLVMACTQSPEATATTTTGILTEAYAKNGDGYADLTVEQLNAMLANKDFTLVNTHVPFEGDLPQTDLSIPFDQIVDNLDQLPEKDAPIVLYCRSGRMSTEAAENLANLGYTNVMELDGGFNAWIAAGYSMAGD